MNPRIHVPANDPCFRPCHCRSKRAPFRGAPSQPFSLFPQKRIPFIRFHLLLSVVISTHRPPLPFFSDYCQPSTVNRPPPEPSWNPTSPNSPPASATPSAKTRSPGPPCAASSSGPTRRRSPCAIKNSIVHNKGLTFVVILPRQSGKNEVQRHLFAWLLYPGRRAGGTIVSVSPTFKPQTINAMERVRLTLDNNIATRGRGNPPPASSSAFTWPRLQFFSGEPRASVVGATADLLLSVDEAQDIDPAKFDKEFDPMTASTNATRVFWGTAWTSQTLLARQRAPPGCQQEADGIQRLFFYTAEDVAAIVPEYAAHLDRVIKEKGRQHPLVRTQYFNEEIDAMSGMFNAGRLALMFAADTLTPPEADGKARSGKFAFLIDVGGMDEANLKDSQMTGLDNPGRDSTTLSVVEIDLSTLETLQAPTYRVVHREAWTGLNHVTVFGKLKALAETWHPLHIVIDATGVGEGLWAMLDRAFSTRVIPVKFTQQEKSEIGWRFLSIIETGRFRAFALSHVHSPRKPACSTPSVSPRCSRPRQDPALGRPDGKRGPDGELVHDDLILADALVAKLDQLEWSISFTPFIIRAKDPLAEMSRIRKPSRADEDFYRDENGERFY